MFWERLRKHGRFAKKKTTYHFVNLTEKNHRQNRIDHNQLTFIFVTCRGRGGMSEIYHSTFIFCCAVLYIDIL